MTDLIHFGRSLVLLEVNKLIPEEAMILSVHGCTLLSSGI
jgi:hypothetical protein